MTPEDKYYELCYSKRIHEFKKIDQYKNWPGGKARLQYKTLNEFYQEELGVSEEELDKLRETFARFNSLYTKYHDAERQELFSDPEQLTTWYDDQKESCHYCKITQAQLHKIVEKRNGNLTLNQKTKRSKGTLEIEKLDPSQGYSFDNAVLACPFCNNAKSNLISDTDWRKFFVPAIQDYFKELLSE